MGLEMWIDFGCVVSSDPRSWGRCLSWLHRLLSPVLRSSGERYLFLTRSLDAPCRASPIYLITRRSIAVIVCVLACTGWTTAASPPVVCSHHPSKGAQLYNLNSPRRIPGQYIVTFRSPEDLACVSSTELNALRILPGLAPDSPRASRQLADALARSIGATVIAVSDRTLPVSFLIGNTNDREARVLARDPRIATIEANLRTEQQQPHSRNTGAQD